MVSSLSMDRGGGGACNRTGRCRGRSTSRVNDDQVARRGRVNRALDRARGGDVWRRLAADGDGHGINRSLLVAGREDQFPAACRGVGGTVAWIAGVAKRHSGRHGNRDRCVTSTGDSSLYDAGGYSTGDL